MSNVPKYPAEIIYKQFLEKHFLKHRPQRIFIDESQHELIVKNISKYMRKEILWMNLQKTRSMIGKTDDI